MMVITVALMFKVFSHLRFTFYCTSGYEMRVCVCICVCVYVCMCVFEQKRGREREREREKERERRAGCLISSLLTLSNVPQPTRGSACFPVVTDGDTQTISNTRL